MIIREAQQTDADRLATLLEEFNRPYRMLTLAPTTVAARLERSRSAETTLVADADGVLVGFVCVRIVPQMSDDQPYAEVSDLFVTEHARRRGHGRALLLAAEERARSAGADALVLVTGFENDGAQDLYRSVGFDRWALAMKKPLA